MLTVSVPTYRTPPALLTRAVEGLLAQVGVDIRVVVVADGGPLPEGLPDDPRLVVYRLPENRGRYFCDAVVLAACDPDGWFAVHDADDWAEPEMYAELIAAAEDGAAAAPFWRHELRRPPEVQHPKVGPVPHAGVRHIWHWCAAVQTVERARAAGGVHPGFRIGYDTLFTLMVRLTGPVGVAAEARWHWQRRNGSLTRSADTHPGSVERARVKALLRRLYVQAWQAYVQGEPPGKVVAGDIPGSLAGEVDGHAWRLRGILPA